MLEAVLYIFAYKAKTDSQGKARLSVFLLYCNDGWRYAPWLLFLMRCKVAADNIPFAFSPQDEAFKL